MNTPGLRAEHGLAFYIQAGRQQFLFDTGQSSLLIQNASKLPIDLRQMGTVILSHSHHDHASGL